MEKELPHSSSIWIGLLFLKKADCRPRWPIGVYACTLIECERTRAKEIATMTCLLYAIEEGSGNISCNTLSKADPILRDKYRFDVKHPDSSMPCTKADWSFSCRKDNALLMMPGSVPDRSVAGRLFRLCPPCFRPEAGSSKPLSGVGQTGWLF